MLFEITSLFKGIDVDVQIMKELSVKLQYCLHHPSSVVSFMVV